jgi:hypothetical protein
VTLPNSDPSQAQGSGQSDPTHQQQNAGTSQSTAAGGTGQTPSPEAQEWEKKYKGLQTAYNKLDGEKKKVQDDLNSSLGTIEEQKVKITNLEKQVVDLTSSVGVKDKEVQGAKGEATAKAMEVTRLKLIVDEFPQLAVFEKGGVLPTANSTEELRTKFTAFATAMSSIVGDSVKDKLKGAGLPAGQNQPVTPTIDSLYDQMSRIAGLPGKQDEYRKLRDQYDALMAAQNASAK